MTLGIRIYTIAGGLIGGLAAAVFGFIDYLDLSGPAVRTGTFHMFLNLGVTTLYALSWYLRTSADE